MHLRGALSFSTVFGQLKGVEESLPTAIILTGCEKFENRRFRRVRNRENRNTVSRLLKVVETQIWAQNDRNGRVYISTYNNPKL